MIWTILIHIGPCWTTRTPFFLSIKFPDFSVSIALSAPPNKAYPQQKHTRQHTPPVFNIALGSLGAPGRIAKATQTLQEESIQDPLGQLLWQRP